MTPNDGITINYYADILTLAKENVMAKEKGFVTSLTMNYIINYLKFIQPHFYLLSQAVTTSIVCFIP